MSRDLRMTLSLDLDNKWSYLKTHGSEGWRDFPSYLDVAVPRILEFLAARDLQITFFVVGQDAALSKNRAAFERLRDSDHEIASHSFNHDPWLHLYSEEELDHDLERAEASIEEVTGRKVRGFRGPGFSLSAATLRVLHRRGYDYDATAFPNVLNPMARAYFFAKSNLSDEEKQQRKALFGSFSDALRPVKPYRWTLDEGELLELPVTTMPWLKIPIHFSYLVYLAGFSPSLARAYARTATLMCRLTHTEPSLLLHPLDFLGVEDDSDLGFFPAMQMPRTTKLESMDAFFGILLERFRPSPIGSYLSQVTEDRDLPRFDPSFSH